MSTSDIWISVAALFFPVLVLIAVLSTVVLLAAKPFLGKQAAAAQYPFLVSFGFLGGVSGLIAGVSQQPIVSALLTALLGLISSLLTYLLSRDAIKSWRPSIPFALILLLVSTLGGLCIGGSYRAHRNDGDRAYARRLLLYEKVDLEVCKQERLAALQGKPTPDTYKPKSCPI